MSKNLSPDCGAMLQHLEFLFAGQPSGKIEIAYTPPTTGAVSKAEWFDVTEINAAAEFAAKVNAEEGVNVYVGAALRKPDTAPFGRSSSDDYYLSTAIWCDLDDAGAAKAAKDKYAALPPSFVVVTGRHPDLRAQVWWKLEQVQSDPSQHKANLGHICAALGGDKSVVDFARVMRLGGSIAWPKKEGRVAEMTEIKMPSHTTKSVASEAFKSYFPITVHPSPVDKPVIGEVGRKAGLNFNQSEWSTDDVLNMLNHIHPDNDYLDWVQIGMALKDYGMSFDIWDAWSAKGGKYPGSGELAKKWNSFKGSGVSIGTIYYHAHQGGFRAADYKKPSRIENFNYEAPPAEEYDPETGEFKAPEWSGLPLVFAGDVQPVTEATDFVEDLLREKEFSVIYGESNCGKTFFMLDLAMHVALGMKWRGKEVDQGGVIYAALEGGHGTKNRIVAFREHHKVSQDTPLAIIPSNLNFLDVEGDITKLVEAVQYAKSRLGNVKLIVIDTLARAISGGDENSSTDMGQLIINADILRGITGAHIAFVHHCGKDSAKGARGHSSLRAAVDTEIEISRENTDAPSTIKVVKQREMEMIDDMAFSLKRTVLGINKRGKEVTSCVVIPADVVEKAKVDVLNPTQQFVYDALVEAIITHGKERNIVKDMPAVKCVDYDELRVCMEKRGSRQFFATENKTTSEQIKSATFTARAGLKKKGKINMTDGYIWIVGE